MPTVEPLQGRRRAEFFNAKMRWGKVAKKVLNPESGVEQKHSARRSRNRREGGELFTTEAQRHGEDGEKQKDLLATDEHR